MSFFDRLRSTRVRRPAAIDAAANTARDVVDKARKRHRVVKFQRESKKKAKLEQRRQDMEADEARIEEETEEEEKMLSYESKRKHLDYVRSERKKLQHERRFGGIKRGIEKIEGFQDKLSDINQRMSDSNVLGNAGSSAFDIGLGGESIVGSSKKGRAKKQRDGLAEMMDMRSMGGGGLLDDVGTPDLTGFGTPKGKRGKKTGGGLSII